MYQEFGKAVEILSGLMDSRINTRIDARLDAKFDAFKRDLLATLRG